MPQSFTTIAHNKSAHSNETKHIICYATSRHDFCSNQKLSRQMKLIYQSKGLAKAEKNLLSVVDEKLDYMNMHTSSVKYQCLLRELDK